MTQENEMKIYTKTGDTGDTLLFGVGRVSKDHLRIEAYGTVDELNSVLGVAATEVKSARLLELIRILQNQLFVLGSDIACPPSGNSGYPIPRIDTGDTEFLEKSIDLLSEELEELKNFILPGGGKGAAQLHLARSVCRRAERLLVTLAHNDELSREIVIFVNRLSDLLFVMARYENKETGHGDIPWINEGVKLASTGL